MDVKKIAKLLQDKEQVTREVVLDYAQKKGQIIHGSRSFNYQAPPHLQKETKDYDLLSAKPKKSAKEVAEILKRRLEGDIEVTRGVHRGTWKVLIDKVPTIDYTQMKHKVQTKSNWGNKVRSLKSIKQNTQRLVKDPKKEFRRIKDLDTLKKIREIERIDSYF